MDAFSSFRTRQLQTNRTSFLDLSSFKDNRSEFDDTDGYSDGSPAQSFLEDLHVVRKLLWCVHASVQPHALNTENVCNSTLCQGFFLREGVALSFGSIKSMNLFYIWWCYFLA